MRTDVPKKGGRCCTGRKALKISGRLSVCRTREHRENAAVSAAEPGDMRRAFQKAFRMSLPILCSYLFVSMAYGLMMSEAGFGWLYTLFASLAIYTGAFQFVLISFLSGGAAYVTIALTALLMNSRQTFYSLTFLDDFKSMGRRRLYMIHTMTDEMYAVNCTLDKNDPDRKNIMFFMALLSRSYWMTGAVLGGILGQIIPFDLTGIDFCMTALFIILIDQWEKQKSHLEPVAGGAVGILCLCLFGKQNFILPALLMVSGILVLCGQKRGRGTER